MNASNAQRPQHATRRAGGALCALLVLLSATTPGVRADSPPDQTITFGALADKTLANSPVTISATASSGLTVAFSSTTPSVCTVAGTSVTLITTGTCTIVADQVGDGTYDPAPSVPRSFAIGPAGPASVSVTGGTFTYTGTPHQATGFAYGAGGTSDVLTPAVTFSYMGTGSTTYGPIDTPPTGAGTYAVIASFAGNGVYDHASSASAPLSITKVPLTVIVNNSGRPYGSPNPAFAITLRGFVNGETAVTAGVTGTPSCTTTARIESPVDAYPVTCSVGSLVAANYSFLPPAGGALLVVSRVPLTVAASDTSRPFGVANPTFTVVITGFVNGQTLGTSGVTGGAACATTATPTSPAGTYPITCTIGSLAAVNYSFTFASGTLTVVRGASSVTLSTTTTVFETRTPVVFTATVEPGITGATPSGSLVFKVDGVARPAMVLDSSGRGSVSVTWTTTGTRNVDVAYTGDGSFAAAGTASVAPTVVANTARAIGLRLSSTSVYPIVDGWRDTVTARGIRSERLALAIEVRNTKGTVVRRYSAGTAAGAYAWTWNGRTSKGVLVPAGRYTIVQTLTDPYGSHPRRTVTSTVTVSLKKIKWATKTITAGARCFQFSSGDGVGSYSCSSTATLRLAGDAGHWPGVGYQFLLPPATGYRSIRIEVLGTSTSRRPTVGLHDWALGSAWGQLYRPGWGRTALSPTATHWSGTTIANPGSFISGRSVRVYVDGGGRLPGAFRFDIARVRVIVSVGTLQ